MDKLNVIYEDNQIIVVIKPHNVPSQDDESGDNSMLTFVKEYVKEKYNKPGNVYIGLVQRLDRPTGGIMVFARTSKAAERLSAQLRDHTFEKTYYAVCEGVPKNKEGKLCDYLKKDEKTNTVKKVPMSEDGAKKCELEYKVLETNGNYALLQINLKTGRSHQIRVQMAGINHALVGDAKYGKATGSSKNLALWAGRATFVHPTTKDVRIFIVAPDETNPVWSKFNISKYFVR